MNVFKGNRTREPWVRAKVAELLVPEMEPLQAAQDRAWVDWGSCGGLNGSGPIGSCI